MPIRHATLDDVPLIVRHRHLMFADNHFGTPSGLAIMDAAFEPWLRAHMAAGTYIGLFLEEENPQPNAAPQVLAACGIYFLDWPPHYLHAEPTRGYLLNFYTEPAARGRGYARQLLQAAVDLCHQRGATVVTLHASPFGRPIYEAFGFKQSNEMMLRPQPAPEA